MAVESYYMKLCCWHNCSSFLRFEIIWSYLRYLEISRFCIPWLTIVNCTIAKTMKPLCFFFISGQ